MAQNRSSAVMQQRVEPHDSLEYFPTPPWATRALCQYIKHSFKLSAQTVWEPACGEGHMAKPLAEYFKSVQATDIHDYSGTFPKQNGICDFLLDWPGSAPDPVDWIISNPPFRLGEEFILRAISLANVGCAMFVRTSFLEGMRRYKHLFERHWPALILQFTERVPLFKGRLDATGSSATSYCWIIWSKERVFGPGVQFNWIAPCRKKLERPGDYPRPVVPDPEPMGLFPEMPG